MHTSWQAGELGVGGTSRPEGNRVSLVPKLPTYRRADFQELAVVLLTALG